MLSKLIKILLSSLLFVTAMGEFSSGQSPAPVNKNESNDSLAGRIIGTPTTVPPKKEEKLKSKVKYSAKDSIRFDVDGKKVFLYGNAEVKYEDITLKSGVIEIDWTDETVYAHGRKDSLGKIKDTPEFSQGPQVFHSQTMKYNFKTKKGKLTEITTNEGEGHILGETVKKDQDNNFYILNGKYTTCSLDTPHFHIGARKLEVIKDDKIVTGPAFLYIENIPTPLFLPFGFFPHKNTRSSGILIPFIGENQSGFNLRNGGYYWGISDNMDLTLRGDIYTNGSWASYATSNYVKRYRFNGNFRINYSNTINGEKDLPDHSVKKDFMITWMHNQDPKSNPYHQFRANVNLGSSSFYRNFITYNPNNYLSNSFNSSISYSRIFPGKPYSLSVNGRSSQSNPPGQPDKKLININLPDIAFNVTRLYPFKLKTSVGSPKWYEKLGFSYALNATNNVQVSDFTLSELDFTRKMRNGIKHSIPISTSLNLLNYLTLTPSISYNEYWYFQSIRKTYNPLNPTSPIVDTIAGFKTGRDFAFSAGFNTRVYGLVQFRNKVIKAVRHVVTPTVSFSWRPDFSDPSYGIYKSVQTSASGKESKYSIFERGVYGGPAGGKSGLISFSLDNNLEMKVRDRTDTATGTKKIKIFESVQFFSSYNMIADSLKLSPISVSGRTTLIKQLSVLFSGTINPYIADSLGRVSNTYEWERNRRIGRLTNANFSLNFSFNSQTDKKKPAVVPQGTSPNTPIQPPSPFNINPAEYADFNIPWDFAMNYNLVYTKRYGTTTAAKAISPFTQSLTFYGNVNVTDKWKIGFNSGYDFISKSLTYTTLNIQRDLHCWVMSFFWVPFGFSQSYNFQINVKSSVLQDLKFNRRSNNVWTQ